jgi:hypothetical protein
MTWEDQAVRLAGAAPRLLAALEALLVATWEEGSPEWRYSEVVRQAQDAIREARG